MAPVVKIFSGGRGLEIFREAEIFLGGAEFFSGGIESFSERLGFFCS